MKRDAPAALLNGSARSAASSPAVDLGLYGAAPAAFAVVVAPASDLPAGSTIPASGLTARSVEPTSNGASDEGFPASAQTDLTYFAPLTGQSESGLSPFAQMPHALSHNSPEPDTALQAATSGVFMAARPADTPMSFDVALIQQRSDELKQAIADLKLSASDKPSTAELAPIVTVQQQAAEVIGTMTQLLGDKLSGALAIPSAPALAPASLSSTLEETLLTLENSQSALEDRIETVIAGLADGGFADLKDGLAGAVAQTEAGVSAVFAALEDSASTAITSAGDAAKAVVERLDDSAAEATGNLVQALGEAELVDGLLSTAADGAGLLDETLVKGSLLGETLADMKGDDPLGGIQTLTGLVSAADLFQLHDEALADVDLPEALGIFGTADLLAFTDDDALHPGLLGLGDGALKDLGLHDIGKISDVDLGHG